jgi:hypothetical protein
MLVVLIIILTTILIITTVIVIFGAGTGLATLFNTKFRKYYV